MLYKSQLKSSALLCWLLFNAFASLLIFCVDNLSLGLSGVLNSPTIIVLLWIFPFMAVTTCLTYWCTHILGSYIFTMVIYSSWIDPLIIMKCFSLFFITVFILKPILSDRSFGTPAFFWFSLAWNIFLHPLTYSLYVGLLETVFMWILLLYPFSQSIIFWLKHLIHFHLMFLLAFC